MIKDLELAGVKQQTLEPQVCIVGAGTAGIFLAQQLHAAGVQVLLLEAGDEVARSPGQVDQICEQDGVNYRGASLGRSFGLGGTSVLWGGQMIPLASSDLAPRPFVDVPGWPVAYDELKPYFRSARSVLGIPEERAEEEERLQSLRFPELQQMAGDFDLRVSSWLPFRTRNFSNAFAHVLKNTHGVDVWLNASVTGMDLGPDRRIERIRAVSRNGHSLTIKPKIVVICAGALESTRLLMHFDEASQGTITRHGSPLGRYFSDHLSVTCGRFTCHDWHRFNVAVAPIFSRGMMRTPRLDLSEHAQKRLRSTSGFAHFTFTTAGDTGFDIVRDILRRRQGETKRVRLSTGALRSVIADVAAMAWWRGVKRRLWIPRQAKLLLQVDVEQQPNWSSRLYLDDQRDALGRKRLAIDWKITDNDLHVIRKIAESACNGWRKSSLAQSADLQEILPEGVECISSIHDVYHPTGSVRMGDAVKNSVVDRNLKLWAAENCYVSTTAVFPSGGSANPGLTHLAMTSRLAGHVAKQLLPSH